MRNVRSSWQMAALIALIASPHAQAQKVDKSLYAEIARSIRKELPAGQILTDPDTWATRGQKPLAADARAALTEGFGGESGRIDDVVQCPGKPGTCSFSRGDAVVAVGDPTASGDTVRVHVHYVTRSPSSRQPVNRTSVLLTLVRRGGQRWEVVERTLLGTT